MTLLQKIGTLTCAVVVASISTAGFAIAGEVWDEIKPAIFGDRLILKADAAIELKAPYRSTDDRVVPVSVETRFTDGRLVKSVTFVIDENPMPVTAVFNLERNSPRVELGANMRFNGPTPMRVIVETSDGRLFMREAYVKTSGQGACAAPPVTVMADGIDGLGAMQFADLTKRDPAVQATVIQRNARLKIQHPNLTGLQMDQISLQYIPARYVSEIEVHQGEERLFTMNGGISLSENPEITFSFKANGAEMMNVRVTDTDGTKFENKFPLGAGS